MISGTPIHLWQYLGLKKHALPVTIVSRFYLSWEDGFWDLLRSLNVPQNSLVLVPSFFCDDVIINMRAHGLKSRYYALDNNLQPTESVLRSYLKKYQPKILILFHPVGITNQLVSEKFIKTLPKDLIIIEDAVHRIVNQTTLRIYSENHFCLTSLRKVVPLSGGFIYGQKAIIEKLQGSNKSTIIYSSQVLFLWLLMQILLNFGLTTSAEKVMTKGYDLIGDSPKPGWCPAIFAWLYPHINVEKTEKLKTIQTQTCLTALKPLKTIQIPQFNPEDFGKLRGFPVILSLDKANKIITGLRQNGILVRSELDGCPWAKSRKIIYLPTGPHINFDSIKIAIDTIITAQT